MFKVQYQNPGLGLWNLSVLPTSFQMAVRVAPAGSSAQVADSHIIDVRA